MNYSIIIPAKNELADFKRVLPQYAKLRPTFQYELIIADGASTDGSIEFARTIADKVEVKTKQGKETIGEGRNRGARVASGDVLCFFDAGVAIPDIAHFFETVEKTFADTRVVAAAPKVHIDPQEAILMDRIVHGAVNGLLWLWNALGIGAGKGEAQIVRRSAFESVGGYNERLVAAEDNDLFRRLAKVGKVVFLSGLTVYDDPRRYRRLGYPRVITKWLLNQFSVMLFGRSYDREWKRVD